MGHSTALTLIVDNWLKAINNGKLIGCILVDFRKAFDLVDHSLRLQTIRHFKMNYHDFIRTCVTGPNKYI